MNEYKVHCVCARCGKGDKWYMLSEKSDKDSVISEAYGHLERVEREGYKCNQCLGTKFVINSVTLEAD